MSDISWLQRNTPVVTLSNFWRATRELRGEELSKSSVPNLIIPDLKNHRHIGGFIPASFFTAYAQYCTEQSIKLNPVILSASQAKQRLSRPRAFFSSQSEVVFLTFEKNKETPAMILVAVSPDIFFHFQRLYHNDVLGDYIRRQTQPPHYYQTSSQHSERLLLNVVASPDAKTVFMRVAPEQTEKAGERRKRVITPTLHEAFTTTATNLRGNKVGVGHAQMQITDFRTGRSSFSLDPEGVLILQDTAQFTIRNGGKTPISSIELYPTRVQPAVNLLLWNASSVKLRVNETLMTLEAC